MKFDESNARITSALTNRTIDHVLRVGNKLEMVCTDGHVITLFTDANGDIQLLKVGVRIELPGVSMFPKAGVIGG